jgi:radical SAM superfamily enzyme YgiQ (UPF0313 family)
MVAARCAPFIGVPLELGGRTRPGRIVDRTAFEQMDVLLSHGFYLALDAAERRVMRPYPPLGILYLSSHLKNRGIHASVFDATFESPEVFQGLLARERPPVVGLSANLMTRASVIRMFQHVRAAGAFAVAGGPDPANYPAEYLAHGADVVVLGEGELTFEELVPHLLTRGRTNLERIQGIAFRDGAGHVVRTSARAFMANLDAQPFPDRDAVDIGMYVDTWRAHHGLGSVSLITARGCPYTCAWCSHSVFGYSHRRRSPANVADELELIVSRWKPDMVWYADDVFTINHRWLKTYSSELSRRGLRVPFETISREDRIDDEAIATLAKMGCLRLWIGSESGSQRVMDAMSRQTDVERVRTVVTQLQTHGIEAGLFVMLGYDTEELSDLEATVAHLKACKPDRFLTTVAYPIKGTPYFDRVADRVTPSDRWELSSDRQLGIAGRRSRRFYEHATRWMVNEVGWHVEWHHPQRRYSKVARAFVNARLGRLGMRLTQHDVEGGHA